MWLTDLLRKITKGPDVGETFRNYIGCYLYGTENSAGQLEYVGAPATLEQLNTEVQRYLQDFIATQSDTQHPDVITVQALLTELPQRLAAHVASDMEQPLLSLSGTHFFIRKGMRERRKEGGRFVE